MKVLISGDFCPNYRVTDLVEQLDVNSVFNDFIELNKSIDYSLLNLECPIKVGNSNPINKIGPVLSTNEKAVKLLKIAGFDGVTLANNHIKDISGKGVIDTIEVCTKYSIDTVGAGKNKAEASKVLFKVIDEIKIGIYNVTENEFSIVTDSEPGANPLNTIDDYYNIKEARKQCDFLIMIYHGGHEGYSLPSPRMKKLFRFYVEAGASVVICHHAHRYSGFEVYKESPIFYGLGNFCFDWPNAQTSLWNEGYSVMLNFVKGENVAFEIYGYKQGTVECKGVRMLSSDEDHKFRQSLSELNEIIEDDLKLFKSFEDFCKSKKYSYLVNFEPYNHKVSRALFKRGFLPSFLEEKKLLNYLRCESHLDVINNLFNKY